MFFSLFWPGSGLEAWIYLNQSWRVRNWPLTLLISLTSLTRSPQRLSGMWKPAWRSRRPRMEVLIGPQEILNIITLSNRPGPCQARRPESKIITRKEKKTFLSLRHGFYHVWQGDNLMSSPMSSSWRRRERERESEREREREWASVIIFIYI